MALAEKSEEAVWGDMHVGDLGGAPHLNTPWIRGRRSFPEVYKLPGIKPAR